MKPIQWKLDRDHFPFNEGETKTLEQWAKAFGVEVSRFIIEDYKEIRLGGRAKLEKVDQNIKIKILDVSGHERVLGLHQILIKSDVFPKELAEKIAEEITPIIEKYNRI